MTIEQSNGTEGSDRQLTARERLEDLRQQIINEECPACRGYLREDYDKVLREVNSGDPTEEFLRWLVRMDDPADEQGVKDRQTIRLSAIIDRARALLGEA